jgi:hypothetical protein
VLGPALLSTAGASTSPRNAVALESHLSYAPQCRPPDHAMTRDGWIILLGIIMVLMVLGYLANSSGWSQCGDVTGSRTRTWSPSLLGCRGAA